MSSPQGSVRQRKKNANPPSVIPAEESSSKSNGTTSDNISTGSSKKLTEKPPSEWDYWVAIVLVTLLAIATRFYHLGHPNEVVFDEVHFGKVGPIFPFICYECRIFL